MLRLHRQKEMHKSSVSHKNSDCEACTQGVRHRRDFLQDSSSFLLLKLSTNLIKGNISQNINKKPIPLYGLPTQRDIAIKKSFLPLQNGKVFECRNRNTHTNNHLCMTSKVNMGRADRVTRFPALCTV